ncbi:MAG: pyridoxamine 5-phosphate oxidase [Rhizobiales bacterium]|nr:pyridoxamine 5-phosphate oxidase [Hyphomicrobiales bacterium]
MARAFAQIAFTTNVLAKQADHGSADSYADLLSSDADGGDQLTARESAFISAIDGFYQSTVSETGWPYVQFRGGPAGFLKVIDDRTIAYADFRGNRQYLSVGNLTGDDRVSLILMDYANRQRLKVWGRAKLVSIGDDPDLVARLHLEAYKAVPERAVVIHLEAFDWNCPKHIARRFTKGQLEEFLSPVREEIDYLRAENAKLKAQLDASGS